jgi:hypothetical protein
VRQPGKPRPYPPERQVANVVMSIEVGASVLTLNDEALRDHPDRLLWVQSLASSMAEIAAALSVLTGVRA